MAELPPRHAAPRPYGSGCRGARNPTLERHDPPAHPGPLACQHGCERRHRTRGSGIRRPRSHIQPGPCVHRPGGALRTQAPDPQQLRWSRSSGMTVIPALVVARPSGVAGPSPPVDGRGCVECQAVATRVTYGVGASLRYPARLLHPSPDHGRAGRDVRDAPRRFPCGLAVAGSCGDSAIISDRRPPRASSVGCSPSVPSRPLA